MKSLKIVFVTLLATMSLNACAWGHREQGLLTGIVIGGLVTHHVHASQHRHYVAPPVTYVTPAPAVVYYAPPPVVQYRQRMRYPMYNGECPIVNGYQSYPVYNVDGYGNTTVVCEI